MRAAEFARRLARIEREAATRGAGFRRGATRALTRRAGAALIVPQGRIAGWRLPDGSVACVKERFRTLDAAQHELHRIGRHASHEYVPVRSYRCHLCDGWHLTSRAPR